MPKRECAQFKRLALFSSIVCSKVGKLEHSCSVCQVIRVESAGGCNSRISQYFFFRYFAPGTWVDVVLNISLYFQVPKTRVGPVETLHSFSKYVVLEMRRGIVPIFRSVFKGFLPEMVGEAQLPHSIFKYFFALERWCSSERGDRVMNTGTSCMQVRLASSH